MTEREKNIRLNKLTDEIRRIVNEHDPENDVPIMDGVWNTLEKAFNAGAAELATLRAENERMRKAGAAMRRWDGRPTADIHAEWDAAIAKGALE